MRPHGRRLAAPYTEMISKLSQLAFCALLFALTSSAIAAESHQASGLVLNVDVAKKTLMISCREIPGYMEAMVMPFRVSDTQELNGLKAGTTIDFVLEDRNGNPYATKIKIREFQSIELDPTAARRLKGVEAALRPAGPKAVAVGQEVPDFTLTDQNRREVNFAQLKGKVVAITFMYTRCPFPTYCVRLSDNLARLQKRFHERVGRDLVLLSIVIDAAHDDPATLKKYSRKWNADPTAWHFLTGPTDRIQTICRYFDMNYYPDEGLYIHSFHTAVVDRRGRMVANLEGNEFTAQQLGDLVESVLNRTQQ